LIFPDQSLDRTRRGDQIGYRITSDPDTLHRGGSFGPMQAAQFAEALTRNERQLREMAGRVFDGEIAVSPYKLGAQIACERCDFASVCRFDSWRDRYNLIK